MARGQLARLLGAGEDDFVFTANTTHGLNICARGIEWRPGDPECRAAIVVFTLDEHAAPRRVTVRPESATAPWLVG